MTNFIKESKVSIPQYKTISNDRVLLTINSNFQDKKFEIEKHNGIVDLSCVTLKTIDEIITNLKNYLNERRITYERENRYLMICRKSCIKFTIKIMNKVNNVSPILVHRIFCPYSRRSPS